MSAICVTRHKSRHSASHPFSSFPRRRGPIFHHMTDLPETRWVPACAGTTDFTNRIDRLILNAGSPILIQKCGDIFQHHIL